MPPGVQPQQSFQCPSCGFSASVGQVVAAQRQQPPQQQAPAMQPPQQAPAMPEGWAPPQQGGGVSRPQRAPQAQRRPGRKEKESFSDFKAPLDVVLDDEPKPEPKAKKEAGPGQGGGDDFYDDVPDEVLEENVFEAEAKKVRTSNPIPPLIGLIAIVVIGTFMYFADAPPEEDKRTQKRRVAAEAGEDEGLEISFGGDDESWGEFLLKWGLIFVGAMYVGAPLLVKFTTRQDADMTLEEVPEEMLETLPRIASSFLSRTVESLEVEDFHRVAYLERPAQGNGPRTFMALCVNRDAGHSAVAVAMTDVKGKKSMARYVEFSTKAAGDVVDTNNSSMRGSLPVPANKHVKQVKVEDVARLYKAHKAHCEEVGISAPALPPEGGEVGALEKAMGGELRFATQVGYMYLGGKVYRPTWKGAFLMTWRMLPPLKFFPPPQSKESAQG